jgi:hypothetical protein
LLESAAFVEEQQSDLRCCSSSAAGLAGVGADERIQARACDKR